MRRLYTFNLARKNKNSLFGLNTNTCGVEARTTCAAALNKTFLLTVGNMVYMYVHVCTCIHASIQN